MKTACMAALISFTAISASSKPVNYNIIPEPVEIVPNGEGTFRLLRNADITVSDTILNFEAQYLADYADRYLGIPLNTDNTTGKAAISLVNKNNGEISGGYRLSVSADNGVVIEGNDAAGVFYGVQTLIQLLPTRAGVIPSLPEVVINDYPRFEYRGMHLDVVRHFFPIEYVKRYIDYLAMHKLNYFHWHLSDDQGWRIELKSYPELTQSGSEREGEIFGLYPGKYQELPYGGYYTQQQIREVVRYAADRHITVVPEIDIPGHCMAVLATYPAFSTTPDEQKKCALTWGIYDKFNNVLAPTPEVFKFLKNVFSEVCDLFPGQYIHTGGDECAKRWWRESSQAQDFMRKHNLKDEAALQGYFSHFVQDVIKSKGKTMVGWDEVMEGDVSEDCVIMNWRKPEEGLKAIEKGHKTIFACSKWCYLNIVESRLQDEIGAKSATPLSVEKVYSFQIMPDSISDKKKEISAWSSGRHLDRIHPDDMEIREISVPETGCFG